MDNQGINLPGSDNPTPEQSGRRDFIKKMVMAGAFAAPVVATFARGARASSTLGAELADNAGAPAMNSFEAKLLDARNQANPQKVTSLTTSPPTTRAPITPSNMGYPTRTKNAALPTNTTVKPTTTTAKPAPPTSRAPIVTSNVTVPRPKNATLSTSTTVKPGSKAKPTTSKAKSPSTTAVKGKTKSGG